MAMDINDVLFIACKAPCSSKLTEIIKNEVECGNIITSFDKVTSLPDETYYIMVFRDMPKENYSSIKICHKKNGTEYRMMLLNDYSGCIEIRFNY
ncbi:MAG: hypothetical protein J6O50_11810 [Ruminiclostridium sp.]|nr:hypothetical protein [Ruminiclostridium sp.]